MVLGYKHFIDITTVRSCSATNRFGQFYRSSFSGVPYDPAAHEDFFDSTVNLSSCQAHCANFHAHSYSGNHYNLSRVKL